MDRERPKIPSYQFIFERLFEPDSFWNQILFGKCADS